MSIETIFAWAWGERSTCNHSAPSSGLSSMNCPFPVSSRWSSRRLTGWAAPERILPGRIFIDLSFRDFCWIGLVLTDEQGAGQLHQSRHSGPAPSGASRNDEVGII